MMFVLIFLVGLSKVRDNDAGVASTLVNVRQQVGGSIGLAVLGTVAWSAVASSQPFQAAAAARAGVHASGTRAAALQAQIYHHALATGFSRGYLVSAGFLVLSAIIALAMMRVSRQDLSGGNPMPEPAADVTAPSRSSGPRGGGVLRSRSGYRCSRKAMTTALSRRWPPSPSIPTATSGGLVTALRQRRNYRAYCRRHPLRQLNQSTRPSIRTTKGKDGP